MLKDLLQSALIILDRETFTMRADGVGWALDSGKRKFACHVVPDNLQPEAKIIVEKVYPDALSSKGIK